MPEPLRVALTVVFWCAVGLVIMFFAFWVSDVQLGEIFLWSGMLVGYCGMAWTLGAAYLRAEERGDI